MSSNRTKPVDALTALHTRTSSPRLTGPPPSAEQLENIYRAALRAADHGLLRPWRFLEIKSDKRHKLGELFIQATLSDNPDVSIAQLEKLRNKPLRAPLIIVAISSYQEHPKVPEFEQDLSTAAATQNMLLACHAQNVGAMWRTGSLAYHPLVKEELGLQPQEKIIGFLYLGSHAGPARCIEQPDINEFVQDW